LPDARTVVDAVQMILLARGQRATSPDTILASLDLQPLARRQPRSLSYAETRAVDLAVALTLASPLVLSLHEPLSDVAVASKARVIERIREIGSTADTCVVITTSSTADARALADRVYLLYRGAIVGAGDAAGPLLGQANELVVWVRTNPRPEGAGDAAESGLRSLARALLERPEVQGVAWDEKRGLLRVSGQDLDACALAVADAATDAGICVEAMAPEAPPLGPMRAVAEMLSRMAPRGPAVPQQRGQIMGGAQGPVRR